MKEFYQQHFDDCDYCSELHDGNLPNKDELMDKHTMDAYQDAVSQAEYKYEAWKEDNANVN